MTGFMNHLKYVSVVVFSTENYCLVREMLETETHLSLFSVYCCVIVPHCLVP